MGFQERFDLLLRNSQITARDFVRAFNDMPPKDIKVTESAVSEFQSPLKKRTPRAEVIIKIAAFFSVSTDYLLGVSDIQTRDESVQAAAAVTGIRPNSIEFLKDYLSTDKEAARNCITAIDVLVENLREYVEKDRQIPTKGYYRNNHAILYMIWKYCFTRVDQSRGTEPSTEEYKRRASRGEADKVIAVGGRDILDLLAFKVSKQMDSLKNAYDALLNSDAKGKEEGTDGKHKKEKR